MLRRFRWYTSDMKEFIQGLADEFSVDTPGEVTWSHAVNSLDKLERTLNNPDYMMIESDIRFSVDGIPIATDQPDIESDLTLENLLTQMSKSVQGLKLDFKDPEALTISLSMLKESRLSQQVILNADLLQGNEASPSSFSVEDFFSQCKKYYPSGLLSLGWTKTNNPKLGYTRQNIEDMLRLCENIEQVTFPVRAYLLPTSWDNLKPLIRKDGYSLTVWSNEPIDEQLKKWININTDPQKTFYDFIDNDKNPLRLEI